MSEWTDRYNPFNSWKALTHSQNFEAILKGKPKPPIVVNMDLTNKCNYNCGFCMFGGRERADKTSETFRQGNAELPKGYVLTLPKIWKEWGVKAVCLAGGGEPTLHKDCLEFIVECDKQGLELGFVTNGLLVNTPEWYRTVANHTKFVGFSIDAGNEKDYSKVKGVPKGNFDKVLYNMLRIKQENGKTQIGYKFLLDKGNYTSIYEAAQRAKEAGANHFQFRPAIEPDYTFFQDKREIINNQIISAQENLEDENFKVMGVTHKFNPDLSKKHKFDKCRATYLTSTWCADGKVYMCTDSRGNPWSELCEHTTMPKAVTEYWGTEAHQRKVDQIDFNKNCDRCTLAPYNEMFEQVFMNDKMDRNLI